MEVLSKGMIERWILPHLSSGERGPKPGVDRCSIVQLIFYRLKTGCQWRMLPLSTFLTQGELTWSGVYYHHYEWIKDGSWKAVWINLLKQNKKQLDLSSMQLDGSQSPAKKQGENVGYQGRKAQKTTNALFLSDNQGQPLAIATPQSGSHNDLFDIQTRFEEMCGLLSEADIELNGVFLNADAGFDAEVVYEICEQKGMEANIDENKRNTKQEQEAYRYFDEELYKRRFVIERTNAWIDGFKALLVRFEVKVKTWIALHLMAFAILLLRKINKC